MTTDLLYDGGVKSFYLRKIFEKLLMTDQGMYGEIGKSAGGENLFLLSALSKICHTLSAY